MYYLVEDYTCNLGPQFVQYKFTKINYCTNEMYKKVQKCEILQLKCKKEKNFTTEMYKIEEFYNLNVQKCENSLLKFTKIRNFATELYKNVVFNN